MTLNIATTDDLQQLKTELLTEITKLFSSTTKQQQPQITMLKSGDVKRILKCSDSKLEVLRSSGKLPFKKVLGCMYYHLKDVEALFDVNQ